MGSLAMAMDLQKNLCRGLWLVNCLPLGPGLITFGLDNCGSLLLSLLRLPCVAQLSLVLPFDGGLT